MPHSRRLTPEATDDDRERDCRERNPSNTDNDDPSPPVAPGRRDENSISFRHFLQPQSDVVPSRHRNSRGPNSGSIDLVDGVAMALPDFVQDHLVLDSVASSTSSISASGINSIGNGEQLLGATSLLHHSTGSGSAPLDLSSVASASSSSATNTNHNHSHSHDFTIATSQRNHSYLSKRNRRHQEPNSNANSNSHSNSVSHSNGDVVPLLNSVSASHSQQGPVALPDFLSDGPMLCSTNNSNSHGDIGAHLNSSNCSSPRRTGASSSGSRGSNSSRDSSDSLPQQVERLRRELAEKNRRLSLFESDLARQRSESSMFETAYLNSEQGLQAATRRALAAEARVAELNNELQFFKNQLSERMTYKRNTSNSSGSVSTSSSSASTLHCQPPQNSGSFTTCRNGPASNLDSNRVMEIAFSAEFLVGELMEQLDALKLLAVTSTAVTVSKEKEADDDNCRVTTNTNTNANSTTNSSSTSTNANTSSKDKTKSKDGPKIPK